MPSLADWCGVSMPDRHGLIAQVAVAHSDPEKVAFARSYSQRYPSRTSDEGGAAQVLRDGHSQLIPEIPDELLDAAVQDPEQRELLRNIGMRSAISVPMTAASGKPIGVISFINAESGRVFTEGELELCEELGRRAGIAVENARLYTERSLIAHTLQRALLPPALPEIPGFTLSALYRPAGEENWVGGDFYDAFAVRDGWVAVVGDVAGRGAQAASLTAFARHVFRTAAQLHDDPLDAVAYLNRQLYERAGLGAVHGLLRAPAGARRGRRGDGGVRRPPAALRGAPGRRGRAGRPLGADARRVAPRASGRARRRRSRPATCSCSTPTASPTRPAPRTATATSACRRCCASRSDAEDALRRLADGLADFETGEQADDTAALAIARSVPAAAAERDDQLGSAA